MPTIEEQKMGVVLGTKARKQGITVIWVILLFAWTGIGAIIAVICMVSGFRNAKMAKTLAPDSPVVQSAYLINNILRWVFCIVPIASSVISLIILGILLLFGVVTL